MKKILAFSTALLMITSASSSSVFAADAADVAPDEIASVTADSVAESETAVAEDSTAEDTAAEEAEEETKEEEVVGWHLNLNKAADAVLTDNEKDREYSVYVKSPGGAKRGGVDKWDVQFRVRGFGIEEGHEYNITYRISSSMAGQYYTKISNYDSVQVGDAVAGEAWHNQYGVSTMKSYMEGTLCSGKEISYGDAWSLQAIGKGDTINVSCDFTGIATIPVAEWAFFLGGAGETTKNDCFAPGTEVRFSNLVLTDKTTGEKLVCAYEFKNSDVIGDLDANGVADLTDMTLMSLALIGDASLDDAQLENADVNGDRSFNLGDLAHFRRYLSGLVEKLGKRK